MWHLGFMRLDGQVATVCTTLSLYHSFTLNLEQPESAATTPGDSFSSSPCQPEMCTPEQLDADMHTLV